MQRRQPFTLYLLLAMVCFALAATSGCTKNDRVDTLHATLVAVNAANDGFDTWDDQHQQELVAASKTRAEAEASVAAYQSKKAPILKVRDAVYKAIALAATQTDKLSLDAAITQAADMVTAIKNLMGGK